MEGMVTMMLKMGPTSIQGNQRKLLLQGKNNSWLLWNFQLLLIAHLFITCVEDIVEDLKSE